MKKSAVFEQGGFTTLDIIEAISTHNRLRDKPVHPILGLTAEQKAIFVFKRMLDRVIDVRRVVRAERNALQEQVSELESKLESAEIELECFKNPISAEEHF